MTDQLHTEIPVTEVDLGPGVFAFFTSAKGGVSRMPYESLNVGSMVGDSTQDVERNRGLLEQVTRKPIVFARQVHSNHAQVVSSSTTTLEPQPEADALVTAEESCSLAVYVADCVPVLLADAEGGVIATAHAGRPGLLSRVITSAVEQMVAQGAELGRIHAAIGPAICSACYEVPLDLAERFAGETGTAIRTTRWGTYGIDLQGAAENELRSLGVAQLRVLSECTYEHAGPEGRLFSHRWATHNPQTTAGKSGRFAGIIGLNR